MEILVSEKQHLPDFLSISITHKLVITTMSGYLTTIPASFLPSGPLIYPGLVM